MAGGKMTTEQIEGQIRQEAAGDYKAFSTQILAGQDARIEHASAHEV